MILEVIATTVEDAIVAEQNGADRIELITAMQEGGLTPSFGLIKNVLDQVKIPVNVMVRPHSNSFCYSEMDIHTMVDDIKQIRALGANGVVLGTLTKGYTIDLTTFQTLVAEAEGLEVTFHRAFDEVKDQEAALQSLLSISQVNRILTSGGKSSVVEATNQIRKLIALTTNRNCHILAGSGLTLHNIETFITQTGVSEVHLGSGVRVNGARSPIDPEKLRTIVKRIKR